MHTKHASIKGIKEIVFSEEKPKSSRRASVRQKSLDDIEILNIRDHNPTLDRARSKSVYNKHVKRESSILQMPEIEEIEQIGSIDMLNVTPDT